MSKDNYKQYTTVSYPGKELLKQHSLTESGLWEVRGEDPNLELAGAQQEPHLGVFDGTLEDVIKLAVELPRFWECGRHGGTIKKVSPVKVDFTTTVRVNEIRAEIATTKEQIKKLEAELATSGVK